MILAALPFLIALMMFFASPGYLDVLFNTQIGSEMLAVGAVSLMIGIVVMRSLIRGTLQ